MWCGKTRALPITFATFCNCTFSGEVLQDVVIFAIATFVLTSSRILSSHSCFVLRNAWHKPVKTIDHCDLWVLWSSLHINCAYPFFIFFPIYGCITLRLGTQSKSHVCLKIHRPLPVTSCLSYAQIFPEQRKHERCAHLAFDLFACSMSS